MKNQLESVRLDKWLWSVRLFKTRTQAQNACKAGKVQVNGNACKSSKGISIGDRITLQIRDQIREVTVEGLIEKRVSYPLAIQQYSEMEL